MHTVMLTWRQAADLTAVLAVLALVLTLTPLARVQRLAPFARETAMIAGLYALWQYAGTLAVSGTAGALERSRWIERAEHTLHLPSEAGVQSLLAGNSIMAQLENLYYATMHFTMLFVFLAWLFTWHRDRYKQVRRVLALTTLACLLIQLVPVAPPRMLPGYVDVAVKYHQSVYGSGGFAADQLSAMPSVHVAWAVLIGVVVWRLATGPRRWLGPAHAVITVLVVVATGNHWWADGIVAAAVLGACYLLERGIVAGIARIRPVTRARPTLKSAVNDGILR